MLLETDFSYKYSRSGGVFFALRSRCRGFHVCFDVLVSFINSSRAISGRLLLKADIAVWIASSFNSVLVGIDCGGNGSECSYGNSDVGCHATNIVQSSVDTTLSTWLNWPTAVVKVLSVDFDRYSIRLITPFCRNFVKFLLIFSRNAAIFLVHTPEFGNRSEKKSQHHQLSVCNFDKCHRQSMNSIGMVYYPSTETVRMNECVYSRWLSVFARWRHSFRTF